MSSSKFALHLLYSVLLLSIVLNSDASERDSKVNSYEFDKKPITFKLENKPIWEIGIGGGFSQGFAYPASSARNNRSLFLPYAIYRGKTIRVGSGRLQAVAFEKPRLKLDASLSASFNADSDGNEAREGMPDLDFLFEIGPRLEYRLIDKPMGNQSRSKLSWENYLRAVLSTDFKRLDSRGFRFGSRLRYRYTRISGRNIDFFARFGPVWATEELHDYFYQVGEDFMTASRPQFNARGGYLGSELFYGLRISPIKNFRFIVGSMIGFYDGAANADSPLFETKRSTGYVLALIWSIRQSKETINLFEDE